MIDLRKYAPYLLLIVRLIVGGVFVWAGWAKISEPALFAHTVRTYDILPIVLINPVAIALPWMEVIAGLLLIVGFWTRSNAIVIGLLLITFLIGLGINIARGANMSCGCFGAMGSQDSLILAFIMDLLMLAGTLCITFAQHGILSVDGARPIFQASKSPEFQDQTI